MSLMGDKDKTRSDHSFDPNRLILTADMGHTLISRRGDLLFENWLSTTQGLLNLEAKISLESWTSHGKADEEDRASSCMRRILFSTHGQR